MAGGRFERVEVAGEVAEQDHVAIAQPGSNDRAAHRSDRAVGPLRQPVSARSACTTPPALPTNTCPSMTVG
jgi:hypothetical protein